MEERESQENIQRTAPIVSRAYQLGKEQRNDEAFEAIKPSLQKREIPSYFSNPVGWTIYRYFKQHSATLPPQEAIIILGYYLDICEHKPSMLHSYIMVLAVNYKRLHTREFPLATFCSAWGLDCFRPEDYQATKSTTNDGRHLTFQSLAVRTATLLYKEIKQTHSAQQASKFMPFFETIREKCPDYEFTSLYIANMLAWSGENGKAITQFKSMIIKKQQWYLWMHLGHLLDKNLRISCYCKAITMMDKEDYLSEMHLNLATMLASDNPAQSSYELEKYVDTCMRNGWTLKYAARDLRHTLDGIEPAKNGESYYKEHVNDAECFVFGKEPSGEFILMGITLNKSDKRRVVLQNLKGHIRTNVPLTQEFRKATPGDVFICRYHHDGKRIVLLSAHATGRRIPIANSSNDRKNIGTAKSMEIEGTVKANAGQPFAFVANYFIPPYLRSHDNLTNGQYIRARVAQQPDGRWRVVKILDKKP